MGKTTSNPGRAYLMKKKVLPTKKCGICNKHLNERGIPNRSGICSGCRNDCANGQFGNLKRNINKRVEKAIKDSQFHGSGKVEK